MLQPCRQPGRVFVKGGTQQAVHSGQQCAGLGGKQVHDRPRYIGQRQLGRVADIAVVGGQLPRAFLADRPCGIGDSGQIAAVPGHGLGHCQRTEGAAAGKIGVFPSGAVSVLGKLQPQRERQLRHCGGIAQGGLSRRLPARSARQGLPRRAVAVRRVKRGAHRVKARRHPLHQHTIPSFSGYIRGGWLPPAF